VRLGGSIYNRQRKQVSKKGRLWNYPHLTGPNHAAGSVSISLGVAARGERLIDVWNPLDKTPEAKRARTRSRKKSNSNVCTVKP
jgi:hypothetical protein